MLHLHKPALSRRLAGAALQLSRLSMKPGQDLMLILEADRQPVQHMVHCQSLEPLINQARLQRITCWEAYQDTLHDAILHVNMQQVSAILPVAAALM